MDNGATFSIYSCSHAAHDEKTLVLRITESAAEPLIITNNDNIEHLSIIIAEGVSCTIEHLGKVSVHIDIYLAADAHLVWLHRYDQFDGSCEQYICCYQNRSSSLLFKGRYVGSITHYVRVVLQELYADARLELLAHAQVGRSMIFHTVQLHQASHSSSSLLVKGLAEDRSRIEHKGTITIDAHILAVDADLQSKHLLLGESAHVYAQPMLEVQSHDLHCSHGTSIGTFDEQHLFYLLSRGLDPAACTLLLSDSFLSFEL